MRKCINYKFLFGFVALSNTLRHQTGNFMLTGSSGRITSSLHLQVQNICRNDLQLTDVFLFNDAVAVPLLDNHELLVPGKFNA